MYIEPTGNNFGQNVYVSFEGTDLIRTSNTTFFCHRSSPGNSESMGGFQIQFLIPRGR